MTLVHHNATSARHTKRANMTNAKRALQLLTRRIYFIHNTKQAADDTTQQRIRHATLPQLCPSRNDCKETTAGLGELETESRGTKCAGG